MGGILWHTQGSGKTLTMVWLAKWILTHWAELNARVLIVTDRDELDEQIEKTFTGVDENIARTKSGKDLLNRLNVYDDSLICSLVHKFGRRGGEATENDYDKYIEELKASLPANFETKGNLVVFVDECHRTQSGKLHTAMKTIMPNAVFIGFTGTPLLKRDKKISIEVFGTYIHAYKYNEGVADGVVLDLRYEYRDVPQDLSSQDRVDQWFDVKTRGLSSRAKAKLKEKWGTMQKVYSSRSRLEKVAWDIIQDFNMKPRLMDGNGNAILVADGIPTACKYYEIFQQMGFKKCAIISSYTPNKGELRTDTVSDEDDTETFLKYETYLKMLGLDPSNLPNAGSVQAKVEEFEKEAKRKFVEEPANMKLLIVVDKLLTGFDAPPCTYLYIDKRMQDHGLFQAICRVNRLDDDTKDFGYIVDYKQLFGQLQTAMKLSAEALTMNCKRNVKPEMAELKGKRLIISSEMEEGMRLNTAVVKQLCSTDEIQAEKKYKDPFSFVPSHTLVLYTNHLPKVGANDDGIWRRLVVIPFNAKITGKSDIKNYADYLFEHAGPAIMSWIIEGAKRAIDKNFHTTLPDVVEAAIQAYREDNDWLGQFLEECCEIDPSYKEKSGELYQAYRAHCMQNGEYIRSTTDFYSSMDKAGYNRIRKNTGVQVVGLKLKEGQDFLE